MEEEDRWGRRSGSERRRRWRIFGRRRGSVGFPAMTRGLRTVTSIDIPFCCFPKSNRFFSLLQLIHTNLAPTSSVSNFILFLPLIFIIIEQNFNTIKEQRGTMYSLTILKYFTIHKKIFSFPFIFILLVVEKYKINLFLC